MRTLRTKFTPLSLHMLRSTARPFAAASILSIFCAESSAKADATLVFSENWESGSSKWSMAKTKGNLVSPSSSSPNVISDNKTATGKFLRVSEQWYGGQVYTKSAISIDSKKTYCMTAWVRGNSTSDGKIASPFLGVQTNDLNYITSLGNRLSTIPTSVTVPYTNEHWLFGRFSSTDSAGGYGRSVDLSSGYGRITGVTPDQGWHWYSRQFTPKSDETSLYIKMENYIEFSSDGTSVDFDDITLWVDGCPGGGEPKPSCRDKTSSLSYLSKDEKNTCVPCGDRDRSGGSGSGSRSGSGDDENVECNDDRGDASVDGSSDRDSRGGDDDKDSKDASSSDRDSRGGDDDKDSKDASSSDRDSGGRDDDKDSKDASSSDRDSGGRDDDKDSKDASSSDRDSGGRDDDKDSKDASSSGRDSGGRDDDKDSKDASSSGRDSRGGDDDKDSKDASSSGRDSGGRDDDKDSKDAGGDNGDRDRDRDATGSHSSDDSGEHSRDGGRTDDEDNDAGASNPFISIKIDPSDPARNHDGSTGSYGSDGSSDPSDKDKANQENFVSGGGLQISCAVSPSNATPQGSAGALFAVIGSLLMRLRSRGKKSQIG